MRRLVAVAVVMVACDAVAMHAQTLALSYSKGATYHYTFHLTSDFSVDMGAVQASDKIDLVAKEAITVNSIDSKGVAEVIATFRDAKLTTTVGSGQATASMAQALATLPATHFWIAPDGRALSTYDGAAIPDGPIMFGIGGDSRLVSAVLSDDAVKPGDTWIKSYVVPSPSGAGNIKVTASSKYLRNETFHGAQVAVVETISTANVAISITGSASGIAGTVNSDVTSWIDPSAHRLLKTSMKSSSEVSMSESPLAGAVVPGAGPFTQKGTQTLDLEPA